MEYKEARDSIIEKELETLSASLHGQDTGVEDTSIERTTKFLVNDYSIPDKLKEEHWSVSDKEIVLSNLSDKDILHVRNSHQIMQLLDICSRPPNTYNFKDELKAVNLSTKVFLKANRAHNGFERTQLTTQQKILSIKSDQSKAKKSFFSGVGKMFGRGSGSEQ